MDIHRIMVHKYIARWARSAKAPGSHAAFTSTLTVLLQSHNLPWCRNAMKTKLGSWPRLQTFLHFIVMAFKNILDISMENIMWFFRNVISLCIKWMMKGLVIWLFIWTITHTLQLYFFTPEIKMLPFWHNERLLWPIWLKCQKGFW